MRLHVAALACVLAGCASAPSCPAGSTPKTSELLYFGTHRAAGDVSDADWERFLAASITARFPDGLTVWEARGQWRERDGSITRERTHVVNIVHAGDATSQAAVPAIVAEYTRRFDQEAVLRTTSAMCSSLQ